MFGSRCLIQWNPQTGAPVTGLVQPSINQFEGVASYSDPITGRLLLYTDGIKVWNGAGGPVAIRPTGTTLGGNASAKNSGVIVPVPGSSSKVFVIANGTGNSPIRYTEFNIRGGITQLSANPFNIANSSGSSEVMQVTTHSNGKDFWLISASGSRLMVAPITSSGIGAFVNYTQTERVAPTSWGSFSISPDGRTLATSPGIGILGKAKLFTFKFDTTTGQISNKKLIGTGPTTDVVFYGGGFSPNGSKYYVTEYTGQKSLIQFDLNTQKVVVIGPTLGYRGGDVLAAPNGKVYVTNNSIRLPTNRAQYLHVLSTPDAAANASATGKGVGFVSNGLPMPTGCIVYYGLPTQIAPKTPIKRPNPDPCRGNWHCLSGYCKITAGQSLGVCSNPTCGNGIIEGPEQCDDNNTKANDGCSPTCTHEIYTCGTGSQKGAKNDFVYAVKTADASPSQSLPSTLYRINQATGAIQTIGQFLDENGQPIIVDGLAMNTKGELFGFAFKRVKGVEGVSRLVRINAANAETKPIGPWLTVAVGGAGFRANGELWVLLNASVNGLFNGKMLPVQYGQVNPTTGLLLKGPTPIKVNGTALSILHGSTSDIAENALKQLVISTGNAAYILTNTTTGDAKLLNTYASGVNVLGLSLGPDSCEGDVLDNSNADEHFRYTYGQSKLTLSGTLTGTNAGPGDLARAPIFCGGSCLDQDKDGIIDRDDVDDDNDGVTDKVELGGKDLSIDSDKDGIPDYKDTDFVTCTDANKDGVCDTLPLSVDADADGIPNHLDLDADGDGRKDSIENKLTDTNKDGIPDNCLPVQADGSCGQNALTTPAPDTNKDGTPDFLQVCGDGAVTSGEICDDGNKDNNDACTNACQNNPCAGVTCPGASETCVNGKCIQKDCLYDLDCQGDDLCVNNKCITTSCLGNGDCQSDELCIDGTCTKDPCAGKQCKQGQFCRKGTCVDSCSGVVCSNPQTTCVDGKCTIDPCATKRCAGDETCRNGVCIKAPCNTKQQPCKQGRICVIDKCTATPCHGITCNGSEQCNKGQCTGDRPCDVDVQCPTDVVCIDGKCQQPGCYVPRNCKASQTCLKATCSDDKCANKSCNNGEVCRPSDGVCVPSCPRCNTGEICQNGSCIKDPCEGVTCQGDESCHNGTCQKDACQANTPQCRFGRVCKQNTCIDDPCTGMTCPTGQSCRNGACTNNPTEPTPETTTEQTPETTTEPTLSDRKENVTESGKDGGNNDVISTEIAVDSQIGDASNNTEKPYAVSGGCGCQSHSPLPYTTWLLLFFSLLFVIKRK